MPLAATVSIVACSISSGVIGMLSQTVLADSNSRSMCSFEPEDVAVVDADALEDPVAVKQTVVEHRDLGLVPWVRSFPST